MGNNTTALLLFVKVNREPQKAVSVWWKTQWQLHKRVLHVGWWQQLQLSPGPHHCSLTAVPPHAPHCCLAQVMSDWNFIVKRNLVPLWVNTLCCKAQGAQGRVTAPFYRGRRGAQSLRSGSCRQPATQPQIIFSQSLGDLSDEDGKQPVWNITLRWVKPLLLTRKTLSEGNGLWELMVAQRSAQQDSKYALPPQNNTKAKSHFAEEREWSVFVHGWWGTSILARQIVSSWRRKYLRVKHWWDFTWFVHRTVVFTLKSVSSSSKGEAGFAERRVSYTWKVKWLVLLSCAAEGWCIPEWVAWEYRNVTSCNTQREN